MKKISFLLFAICITGSIFGQKQTYDVVSYTLPGGWQKEAKENGIQVYATDTKTGEYAIAIVLKSQESDGTPAKNFTAYWEKLIKGTVTVSEEPTMLPATKDSDWDIISGQAPYSDGANKGMVTLLSATGNRQTAAVVLMTNTNKYQPDISAFLHSLALSKATENQAGVTTSGTKNNATNNRIAGLWTDYTTESNGYVNGFPQVTGGYTRREYNLKADGTYIFRHKYWSAYMKEILFIYETGTWKINGNQLTIMPTTGKGEWWSKAASGKNSEWGAFKKASDYKPATATYSFGFKYLSGMQQTYLVLHSNIRTPRDGTTAETNNYEESFSPKALDKSLIDNPPGFKK
ncbi:hypothetical protein [Niabella soli]|uniref:Uncharacterized protein n=1 Tax=Niabella soli DSM 19437 TaxID=929713 RepID=W0F7F6_9BACT|nr:hypothetical protein [Niabella soli]AHF17281.1 hypothetical protein NIASO_05105 [Niabella soli DSM 19437]